MKGYRVARHNHPYQDYDADQADPNSPIPPLDLIAMLRKWLVGRFVVFAICPPPKRCTNKQKTEECGAPDMEGVLLQWIGHCRTHESTATRTGDELDEVRNDDLIRRILQVIELIGLWGPGVRWIGISAIEIRHGIIGYSIGCSDRVVAEWRSEKSDDRKRQGPPFAFLDPASCAPTQDEAPAKQLRPLYRRCDTHRSEKRLAGKKG